MIAALILTILNAPIPAAGTPPSRVVGLIPIPELPHVSARYYEQIVLHVEPVTEDDTADRLRLICVAWGGPLAHPDGRVDGGNTCYPERVLAIVQEVERAPAFVGPVRERIDTGWRLVPVNRIMTKLTEGGLEPDMQVHVYLLEWRMDGGRYVGDPIGVPARPERTLLRTQLLDDLPLWHVPRRRPAIVRTDRSRE